MNPVQQVVKNGGVSKGKILVKLFLLEHLLEFQEFNHFFKNFSMASNHPKELFQMKQLHMVQQFKQPLLN
jgi:hypothetical protein